MITDGKKKQNSLDRSIKEWVTLSLKVKQIHVCLELANNLKNVVKDFC